MEKLTFAKNLSEKEYFILACFAEDLQEFYKEWIQQSPGRKQYFYMEVLKHKYWIPGNICSVSGVKLTKDNIDVKIGYWKPSLWKPVLDSLKKEAELEEAYECQKIDANCNDCKYFDRTRLTNNLIDCSTSIFPRINCKVGLCTKHNYNVYASSCSFQGNICFIHRKD